MLSPESTTSVALTGFDGFLFIGDLHIASGKVGRRMDDYGAAILDKLRQAAAICRERNLYPVCLGDLFHRPRENDLELLARTMAACRDFPAPMLVLAGSHDRTETQLTDKDAAHLLAAAGAIRMVDAQGLAAVLAIGSQQVNLWMTPAACRIPFGEALAKDGADINIMVTHHDLDFCGRYPGAQPLEEIPGCDMLINGHMHHPTPMVLHGGMACHNPGSVARPSVDLRKHAPAVSVWTPAHGVSLERVGLKFAENVFDLTGKEAYAASPDELKASLPKGLRLSSFAAKLRGSSDLEAGRTDDGAVLVEELDAYFKLFEKPPAVRTYVASLLQEELAEATSK